MKTIICSMLIAMVLAVAHSSVGRLAIEARHATATAVMGGLHQSAWRTQRGLSSFNLRFDPEVAALGQNGARRRSGQVFRDCEVCPEMVVLPGGTLALGRYEVTAGEYRAFALATSGGAGRDCANLGYSWLNPGFPQTTRHPVTCISWDDAQEYVSWLSRTTGAPYRLPTQQEWNQAAAGAEAGCQADRTSRSAGTCPVGSRGSNPAGFSDLAGNVWEWTTDCWQGDCSRRVLRGGGWATVPEVGAAGAGSVALRDNTIGFRVSRKLN